MASVVSHVAAKWLADEAKVMAGEGTPRRPVLIGGSGLCGTNLLVLLASSPGCEHIVVMDARPPSPAVLSEAGIASKVTFVKHLLGTDSEESLASAIQGTDCVFTMVTPHVQLAAERDFYKTNIDGVKGLIRVCQANGVPRLVYLSSIAVTNHFIQSHNQKESDGLPHMDLYTSPYDITKRRGEEMVLAANRDGFRTCALRPGGILLSPHDFTFRNALLNVGGVNFLAKPAGMKQIDFIDGRDVVRAMFLASQVLETRPEGVAGEAFFCTKGEAADPSELAMMCKEHLGWPMISVPAILTQTVCLSVQIKYVVRKALGLPVTGVPPHKFMQMAFMEQTFDNDKIQLVLGFRPKVPVAEAVARICSIYKHESSMLAVKASNKMQNFKRICFALVAYFFAIGAWNAMAVKSRRR